MSIMMTTQISTDETYRNVIFQSHRVVGLLHEGDYFNDSHELRDGGTNVITFPAIVRKAA
jgi:hypothetical protein